MGTLIILFIIFLFLMFFLFAIFNYTLKKLDIENNLTKKTLFFAFVVLLLVFDRYVLMPLRLQHGWEFESGCYYGDIIMYKYNFEYTKNKIMFTEKQYSSYDIKKQPYLIACHLGKMILYDNQCNGFTIYNRSRPILNNLGEQIINTNPVDSTNLLQTQNISNSAETPFSGFERKIINVADLQIDSLSIYQYIRTEIELDCECPIDSIAKVYDNVPITNFGIASVYQITLDVSVPEVATKISLCVWSKTDKKVVFLPIEDCKLIKTHQQTNSFLIGGYYNMRRGLQHYFVYNATDSVFKFIFSTSEYCYTPILYAANSSTNYCIGYDAPTYKLSIKNVDINNDSHYDLVFSGNINIYCDSLFEREYDKVLKTIKMKAVFLLKEDKNLSWVLQDTTICGILNKRNPEDYYQDW